MHFIFSNLVSCTSLLNCCSDEIPTSDTSALHSLSCKSWDVGICFLTLCLERLLLYCANASSSCFQKVCSKTAKQHTLLSSSMLIKLLCGVLSKLSSRISRAQLQGSSSKSKCVYRISGDASVRRESSGRRLLSGPSSICNKIKISILRIFHAALWLAVLRLIRGLESPKGSDQVRAHSKDCRECWDLCQVICLLKHVRRSGVGLESIFSFCSRRLISVLPPPPHIIGFKS